MLVERVIKKFNKPAADISSLRIVQWAFKVILVFTGTKLTIIGEDRIPKDQAVLYVPNHQSYFDIVITYSRCPGLTGYVSKDFMERVPLLSNWMKHLYLPFLLGILWGCCKIAAIYRVGQSDCISLIHILYISCILQQPLIIIQRYFEKYNHK